MGPEQEKQKDVLQKGWCMRYNALKRRYKHMNILALIFLLPFYAAPVTIFGLMAQTLILGYTNSLPFILGGALGLIKLHSDLSA